MKKITVLGGSGFIGSHLCDALLKKKFKVKILDLKKNKYLKKNFKFYHGSILNISLLSNAIKNSDIVFNFAGLADLDISQSKPLETAKLNIIGTINSLLMCKKYKIKKFIHASSIYANTEEGGFYGCSKKAAEDYIEKFCAKNKVKFSILRFGSLYGARADKGNGVNTIIVNSLKKNKAVYEGSSNTSRKYIHISDAIKACLEVIKKKYDNKFINITGKKNVKVSKLMNIIVKNLQLKDKKLIFLNKKRPGHYVRKPTPFKPRKGIVFKIKNESNLENNIHELIEDFKK